MEYFLIPSNLNLQILQLKQNDNTPKLSKINSIPQVKKIKGNPYACHLQI
jgi:hypothetical protein